MAQICNCYELQILSRVSFFGVLGCGRDMYVYMTIPLSQVFNWHGHITGGKDVNLETKSTVYKLYF